MKSLLFPIAILLIISAGDSVATKPSISIGKIRLAKTIDKSSLQRTDIGLLESDIHQAINSTHYFQLISSHPEQIESISDYHLIPTITNYIFQRQHKPIANINNRFKQTDSANLSTHIEIYKNDNRHVLTSLTFSSQIHQPTIKVSKITNGPPPAQIFKQLSEQNATNLANHLIDSLFPTKVLKINGKTLWINRGKNTGLTVNTIFTVYQSAEPLIDPYTNENIGTQEIKIGKARVKQINPKYSILTCVGCEILSTSKTYIVKK